MINPWISNIGIDANALDRDGSSRDELVDRFQALVEEVKLIVVVAGGVRDEVAHPNTPTAVKSAVLPQIFNLRPNLIQGQQNVRAEVEAVLRGNALPGKHAADASHLSEAAETGCCYFITHDKRMLAKRDELRRVLPPSLEIVTLAEFFDVLARFEPRRA